MENVSSSNNNENDIYSPEGIALMIAGISAAIVSVVYSFKSVKHSDCGWFSCDQVVEDDFSVDDIIKIEEKIKHKIFESTDL